MPVNLTGSCYCRNLKYHVDLDSKDDARTSLCHCSNCKKAFGGAFGLTSKVPLKAFGYEGGIGEPTVCLKYPFGVTTMLMKARCMLRIMARGRIFIENFVRGAGAISASMGYVSSSFDERYFILCRCDACIQKTAVRGVKYQVQRQPHPCHSKKWKVESGTERRLMLFNKSRKLDDSKVGNGAST